LQLNYWAGLAAERDVLRPSDFQVHFLCAQASSRLHRSIDNLKDAEVFIGRGVESSN
jgi:hypothetical protein